MKKKSEIRNRGTRARGSSRFRISSLLLAFFLLVLASPSLAADKPEVLGESGRTARRLQEIADKEKAARDKPSDERWAEVVDELHALFASSGNDLVPAE